MAVGVMTTAAKPGGHKYFDKLGEGAGALRAPATLPLLASLKPRGPCTNRGAIGFFATKTLFCCDSHSGEVFFRRMPRAVRAHYGDKCVERQREEEKRVQSI
ncbi:hypothetical protein M569_17272 [Genlisea aurea]|uniref:Uncharacterized protein n=1 Tax=Genlisea aurea TaxID=192259 RepID=S8BZE5_9LAMI|nr:hypothetical protein M569_17272 [Genlisea aurea]